MKKLQLFVIVLFSILLGSLISPVGAQSVTLTWGVTPAYLLANCPPASLTLTMFCSTGDGHIYVELAGGTAYTCIAGSGCGRSVIISCRNLC